MKNRFFLFILFSVIISVYSGKAQPLLNQAGIAPLNKPTSNFYDIQKIFNQYWKKKSANEKKLIEEKDGEWQQFKRWEWFAEQRVYPSGNFPNPEILVNEYFKYKAAHLQGKSLGDRAANWSFIGPYSVPAGGGGAGRINCMAFDPNNSNNIFIGAACGGIWKSVNGGSTWSSNTDMLPALSISEIVVDPSNSNIMYISTGDKYGLTSQYQTTGNYSAGVMKSIDAGLTWTLTGLNYIQTQSMILQRMIINPVNSNVIMVASNSGIYRSNDAAATWVNVQSGDFYDLEFNPANPNIVFASDNTGIYRSNNAGITWNMVSAGLCTGGRNSIAVTAANSNLLYVWCEGGDFFKSTDAGLTFSMLSSPNSYVTPYGYYDQVLAVSPVDENLIFTGGLNIGGSNDGGLTWNTVSDWSSSGASNYVHADNHMIAFLPGSGSTLFSCNDGGIFKTADLGASWSDLSNGLDIKQYYRMGGAALDPNLIYGGAQDNGTDRINGSIADQVSGADGMECLVDYTDNNIVYVSTQNGYFSKSVDGGNTFTDITPAGVFGDWTTPMVMHPTNPQILFAGFQDVYKSIDGGTSWNAISNSIDGGNDLYSVAVAKSNPNVIYAASFGNIYKTTNGGTNWTNVTQNLPVNNASITGIAINSTNADQVWVTFSGYSNGNKVFNTIDGGAIWGNVSGTLPNIPVNCIVYQNGSIDMLYIGTDFGVYSKDATMNNWTYYNTGLPNVIIDELEIQYMAGKLRAATYGRGIWETDLNSSSQFNNDAGTAAIISPSGEYCTPTIQPVIRIKNFGLTSLSSVTVNYQIDGGPSSNYSWTGALATFGTADISLPSITFASGIHTLTAHTSNPNGLVDNNSGNDSYTISFSINTLGSPLPITEGFVASSFPPAGWKLQNNGGLLTRSSNAGGFGNSFESVQANYFSVSSSTAYLSTPSLDFSALTPPVKLDFNIAYAQYDSAYHDSLIIGVSTDCGVTYSPVYIKGDGSLATTAISSIELVAPANNQWRAETVNLNSYIGSPLVMIRFEFKSGYGNNLFLDDINIYDPNTGIDKINDGRSVSVYPNPAYDQLTLLGLEPAEKTNVVIYNAIGGKVFEGIIIKDKIDIHNFKPGMYVIKISTSKGIVSRKFIKK